MVLSSLLKILLFMKKFWHHTSTVLIVFLTTISMLTVLLIPLKISFALKIDDKKVNDPVDEMYKYYSRWYNPSINHWGADIVGKSCKVIKDKDVYAVMDGHVKKADCSNKPPYTGYGCVVVIEHSNGYDTLYGHLSTILLNKYNNVKAGDKIGRVGNTGNVKGKSGGYHLHYEVRDPKRKTKKNPWGAIDPGDPGEESYKPVWGPTGGPDGGPGGDHPDEGETPPIRDIPQMYYYKDMLDVLVLYWGYPKFTSSLLAKLNISKMYVGIEDNFKNMLGISKILGH